MYRCSTKKKNTSLELIREKMVEKRRRKKALNEGNTSWSRSRSKNRRGTSASFILKASLRSNNQDLARALAVAKHETQQVQASLLLYQRENHHFEAQESMRRRAEADYLQRFTNVKQVLTSVTNKLLDAASSLGQAVDICSALPGRHSSLGLRATSMVSDDDSFAVGHSSGKPARRAEFVSTIIESASSELLHGLDIVATAVTKVTPIGGLQREADPPLSSSTEAAGYSHLEDLEDFQLRFTDETQLEHDDIGKLPKSSSTKLPSKRYSSCLDPATINRCLRDSSLDSLNEYSRPSVGSHQLYRTPPSRKQSESPEKPILDDTPLTRKSNGTFDEQAICPWGNIQPLDETTSKKAPNNATSKKAPSKKVHSKKDTKQVSTRKAKNNPMSESFKRDMAVFDLSADSFSIPNPQLKTLSLLKGGAGETENAGKTLLEKPNDLRSNSSEVTRGVSKIQRKSKKISSLIRKITAAEKASRLSSREMSENLDAEICTKDVGIKRKKEDAADSDLVTEGFAGEMIFHAKKRRNPEAKAKAPSSSRMPSDAVCPSEDDSKIKRKSRTSATVNRKVSTGMPSVTSEDITEQGEPSKLSNAARRTMVLTNQPKTYSEEIAKRSIPTAIYPKPDKPRTSYPILNNQASDAKEVPLGTKRKAALHSQNSIPESDNGRRIKRISFQPSSPAVRRISGENKQVKLSEDPASEPRGSCLPADSNDLRSGKRNSPKLTTAVRKAENKRAKPPKKRSKQTDKENVGGSSRSHLAIAKSSHIQDEGLPLESSHRGAEDAPVQQTNLKPAAKRSYNRKPRSKEAASVVQDPTSKSLIPPAEMDDGRERLPSEETRQEDEDQSGRRSRRVPRVSYKELSVNCKMRRSSPVKKKPKKAKQVSTGEAYGSSTVALATVTNLVL